MTRRSCIAVLLAAAAGLGCAPNATCLAAAHRGQEPNGVLPAELVGKWGFTVASGNYCDDFLHCEAGAGGSVSFTFDANGHTEYVIFESTLVPGCGQIRTLTRKTGRSRIRGGTLVFEPIAGTYRSVNGCRPDLTGTWQYGPQDLKPTTLSWHREGGQLRLDDASGEGSGMFSRR